MARIELISIDPGVHFFAWAVWKGGRLASCGKTKTTIQEINNFAKNSTVETLIVELPQIYQQRKWKGDPNDLVDVAVTVGQLVQVCDRFQTRLVRPREWKGTVNKEVFQNRIVDRLDLQERVKVKLFSKRDLGDVLDAIGLGLWYLDRL